MTSPIPARPDMFTKALPKLQRAWDATSLDSLLRCPRYYQYNILEGWRRDNDTLNFGKWYHEALEAFDGTRLDGSSTEEALDNAGQEQETVEDSMVHEQEEVQDEEEIEALSGESRDIDTEEVLEEDARPQEV